MSATHEPSADRPLRPLEVVQVITTLARGGAQATVVASADLDDPAVVVRILAGTDDTGEGSYWDDPAVARLEVEAVPELVRPMRPHRDALALRRLVARWWVERPDVVHTHSSKAGLIGRLAARIVGVPCVHTVHGWGPINASRGPVRAGVVEAERLLARWSAGLVVVGERDRDLGLSLGIGRAEQYHLIRSGIELDGSGPVTVEQRRSVRAELGLDDRFVVGMVGRLAAQKDQATLIEAFARSSVARRATLVLIGDGPRRDDLERRAASYPDLDIHFLGARPDGPRLVGAFDLAVNASNWEGLPRSVVEAAAAEIPVVASDVGSTADLVRAPDAGWLVAPGDRSGLTRAIDEAADDPVEARRRARTARASVGEFSADRMRRSLVELWSQVAVGRHTDRPLGRPEPVSGAG